MADSGLQSEIDVLTETRRIVGQLRQQKENPSRLTTRVPGFCVADILRLIATLEKGAIIHIYPIVSEDLNCKSFDLSIWRQYAKRGRHVSRVYILPHAGFARGVVEEAVKEDNLNSIQTKIVTISSIRQDSSVVGIGQYVISPNKFVFSSIRVDSSDLDDDIIDWTMSSEASALNSSMNLWASIQEIDDVRSVSNDAVDLQEPLVLSADLISGVSSVLCSGDHVDRSDCSWYHGTWQYLRLLDLVSTPTWHDQFYRHAFREVFKDNPRAKVLISGAADYSLLAYLADAATRENASPNITVIDQCATPLFACRWFAKKFNLKINTVQEDILKFDNLPERFDLITSDAFLTRFKGDTVNRVAKLWHDILIENGKIVTTVRLHDDTTHLRDEQIAIKDFVARARERIPRWRQFIKQPKYHLIECVERYAAQMVSNRIGEERAITTILEAVNLQLIHSERGAVPGELYPTTYLRLVASRKE